MPKTIDAFALRGLYQKCFRVEFNSHEDVNAANDFYKKFLLKGFSMPETPNNKIDERRRTFYEFLYMSRRAAFLERLIERHKKRLEKIGRLIDDNGKWLPEDNDEWAADDNQFRALSLYFSYDWISVDMDANKVNFGEFAKYQQRALKKFFVQELGYRLRTARRRLGLNQAQLAHRLNISQEAYSEYERGRNEPPLYLINELAILFNVSFDWLLGRQPIREEKIRKIVDEKDLPF